MANSNYSDFKEIVRDIDDRKILLPDFQRDFVWKDEERQKKIVASVLTKMPIGSILLLTSSADEYCSKIIGRNADLNTSDITGDVDFLLDGQQRITVLTNVFSNVIHMVIIKGEIKTSEIMSCGYNRNTQKWDVKFNNGKTYSYAYLNVEKLTDPEVLNPNMYRISREGREFFDVNLILQMIRI